MHFYFKIHFPTVKKNGKKKVFNKFTPRKGDNATIMQRATGNSDKTVDIHDGLFTQRERQLNSKPERSKHEKITLSFLRKHDNSQIIAKMEDAENHDQLYLPKTGVGNRKSFRKLSQCVMAIHRQKMEDAEDNDYLYPQTTASKDYKDRSEFFKKQSRQQEIIP